MTRLPRVAVLGALALYGFQAESSAKELCVPLRKFVESVRPDETKTIKFHTIWGSDFKDSQEPLIYAKRCEHYGYEPAKGLCAYLAANGATEFAGINVANAVSCLSPKTQFENGTQLHALSLSIMVGTVDRGQNVDVTYSEDNELGGMVLTITVRGY